MVYILAEIVTKHIKQQLIFNFEQKNWANAQHYRLIFAANNYDKQAVTTTVKQTDRICIAT